MRAPILRLGATLVAVAALLVCSAATASAHIQVGPGEAAPDDAVRFTVLVPGERSDTATDKVVLRVPSGVLPYSFGETPGWERQLVLAPDKSIAQIVWTGTTEPDAFVEFEFLAATPPKPGVLSWKALQYYDDGSVVRWIGAPDSEYPASETVISADAPLQNSGGEGASGGESEGGGADTPQLEAPADQESDGGDSGSATAALVIAIFGALLGASALIVSLRRGRSS